MDELFEHLPHFPSSKPYKVGLPQVTTPLHHYLVRWWLLDTGWTEFEEWMIGYNNTSTGIYEVWFSDLGQATLFKLAFILQSNIGETGYY